MSSKVYSAAVVGVDAFEMEIEVHAGWGNTDKIAIVGLPDTAVKESKDRVTSAISNSAFRWPYGKRITINLARPMSERKDQLRSADCPGHAEIGGQQQVAKL
jgi:magnesium chelatase family protein